MEEALVSHDALHARADPAPSRPSRASGSASSEKRKLVERSEATTRRRRPLKPRGTEEQVSHIIYDNFRSLSPSQVDGEAARRTKLA